MFGTVLDRLETAIDDAQSLVHSVEDVDLDRLDSVDALVRLERVRERLDATVGRLIADLDSRGLHQHDSTPSMAAWLSARTGQRRATTGSRVHLAVKLRSMARTAAALLAGEITATHAAVLARASNPRTSEAFARDEALLVGSARKLTADQLVQVVEFWLRHADPDGAAPRPENDRFFLSQTMDGRLKGSFDVGGDLALTVKLAIDELVSQLLKRDASNREVDPTDPGLDDTPAQRRARALGELCSRAAASPPNAARRRPLFTVHTTLDTLSGSGDPLDWKLGLEQAWSSAIPMHQIELDTCDCWVHQIVIRGEDGQPLHAGREIRTANRAMRRALVARDGPCCAVPGCDRPVGWCDAHHIIHWLDGGGTELGNLVFLCRWHHSRIHAGQLRVEMTEGRPRFTLPDGRVLADPRGSRSPPGDAA